MHSALLSSVLALECSALLQTDGHWFGFLHSCSMACEARIVRVLRTLQYPGLKDLLEDAEGSDSSLANRPHDVAKIVAWIEDRKVRWCSTH